MFQRLLIIALFVVVAILLVRTIANWFNRGGWIGRGQSEIKGSWAVVEPLGRLGKAAENTLKSSLKLEDGDDLQKVAVLFDVAHRTVHSLPLDAAELRILADEASEPIRGVLYRDEAVYAPGWLLFAADLVQDAHPAMYAYEVKRLTLTAYRKVFPSDEETVLPPERTLAPVAYGTPPPVGDQYGHLGGLGAEYTRDAAYVSLLECPVEALPDEAMVPLLQLLFKTEDEPVPDGETQVDELLARYEDRLYTAAVHVMIRPESSASARPPATDGKTRPPATDGQSGPPGSPRPGAYSPALFRVIGAWPRSSAEPLFRAALESGWNDCARFLPESGWARDLKAVFRDSPYGAPA
ncbi:MAG: hypothetical protein F4Y38_11095 [Gemmatimonadetes bacterium]|nr:hypothetical protein [Gemmatimonadota bacterium]MYG83878.1 hypothetical protein [Gemmatimonadota bacterium]MYJ88547.1 hypothetical protein [Gemmatimonadota bacterium]